MAKIFRQLKTITVRSQQENLIIKSFTWGSRYISAPLHPTHHGPLPTRSDGKGQPESEWVKVGVGLVGALGKGDCLAVVVVLCPSLQLPPPVMSVLSIGYNQLATTKIATLLHIVPEMLTYTCMEHGTVGTFTLVLQGVLTFSCRESVRPSPPTSTIFTVQGDLGKRRWHSCCWPGLGTQITVTYSLDHRVGQGWVYGSNELW